MNGQRNAAIERTSTSFVIGEAPYTIARSAP